MLRVGKKNESPFVEGNFMQQLRTAHGWQHSSAGEYAAPTLGKQSRTGNWTELEGFKAPLPDPHPLVWLYHFTKTGPPAGSQVFSH